MPPKTNEELRKKIYDLVKEVHIQKPFEDVTGEPHYVTDEIMKILTQKDKEKEEAVAAARREELGILALHLDRQLVGYTSVNVDSVYRYIEQRAEALTTPLPDQGGSK